MKITRIIIMILVGIISAGAGSALKIQDIVQPEAKNIKKNIEHNEATGSINLVVVGIDDVEGVHRADTVGFVTIDIDNKIVRFMSIPRDTRVQIPGHGWEKINHAFAYGDVKLLEKTLVNYLGMPINYHAVINFDNFPEIVDLLGGVYIDVEKRLYYNDRAGNLHININRGMQHMDGKTALGYVRYRNDALGDIGRVRRQQKFIKAIVDRMKSPDMISKLPKLAKEFLNLINTNLSAGQAIQLASYLKDIPAQNMNFFTLPGKSAYISDISYWIGDLTKASTLLSAIPGEEKYISAEKESSLSEESSVTETDIIAKVENLKKIKTAIAVLNGDGTPGLGKQMAVQLQKLGIDVAFIGNAKHFDYKYSNINYPEGNDQDAADTRSSAKALAEICNIPSSLVRPDDSAPYATIIVGHNYESVIEKLKELNNAM
jgi:LCP family protein required for cell wall assembly